MWWQLILCLGIVQAAGGNELHITGLNTSTVSPISSQTTVSPIALIDLNINAGQQQGEKPAASGEVVNRNDSGDQSNEGTSSVSSGEGNESYDHHTQGIVSLSVEENPIVVDSNEKGTTSKSEESSDGSEQTSVIVEDISNRNLEPDEESELSEATDVIETEGGFVAGFNLHPELAIESYLDIPYGRFTKLFSAPEKHPGWEGTHEIREHTKRCPQLDDTGNFVGEFDCLTLSVFTPTNASNLPVLFHIYDSQFQSGSADYIMYGPEYLNVKGAIIVLPNYRIGPLGFLCLLNDMAPGNAALKDLTLALEWTQENIAKFGGDPSNIIVSGDGLTSALAGYLALSAKSKHLVSGVIIESGSPLAHWALDRNPLATAAQYPYNIHDDLDILSVQEMLLSATNIIFRPCVENGSDPFLNATPWEILHCEQKLNISFMIGSASRAGMHEALQETPENLEMLNNNFSLIFPDDLEFTDDADRNEIADKVRNLYFGDRNIDENVKENISLYYTDADYLNPAIRFSRALLEAGATVFFYEFSFVGGLNKELLLMETPLSGAARGDIVGYTFTQDKMLPEENSAEGSMVESITDWWLTFMKHRYDSFLRSSEVTWNQLQKGIEGEEEWLSIGSEVEMQKGLHVERLLLWTEIYNNHFIERNGAVEFKSSVLVHAVIFLFLGIYKGVY